MTLTHAPGDTRASTDTSELPVVGPAAPATAAPVDDLHEAPDAPGPLGGVPGLVGLPVVVTGGTGLVLANLGLFPEGAVTATLTILLGCTVVGLTIATVWAAALGDSVWLVPMAWAMLAYRSPSAAPSCAGGGLSRSARWPGMRKPDEPPSEGSERGVGGMIARMSAGGKTPTIWH